VAVAGNKIVYVGDNAGAADYVGEGTERFDLEGKMLMPGLMSGHEHSVTSLWMAYGVPLGNATSTEEYLQLIKEYADANPDEEIVRGQGWTNAGFGSNPPTAADLDAIVPDRPALIIDINGHDAWLNTKAMEIANITKDTPDAVPSVTYWVRDEDGNPTGIAYEFAWLQAFIANGAWDPESIFESSQAVIEMGITEGGINTHVVAGLVTPNLANPAAYIEDYDLILGELTKKDKRGDLKARVFIQAGYKDPTQDAEQFAASVVAVAKKYTSDRVRANGVKLHTEGVYSGQTALMLEPYFRDGKPIENPTAEDYGAAGMNAEQIKAVTLAANAKGLDVAAHNGGTATVRNIVDAYEAAIEAGYTDARNVMHHTDWVHPDDIQRIIDLKIPVNTTPTFASDFGGNDILAMKLMGEQRIKDSHLAYPPIIRAGNIVSFGSDIPSLPIDHISPLNAMEAALTLKNPRNPNSKAHPPGKDGITLEQAIKAVTINVAWQIRMEDKLGSLEVGKYADLVVLEQNLFDVPPDKIADVKVVATVMDGEFTYRDGL
jgi:predicted amidohydrolase YtcJ